MTETWGLSGPQFLFLYFLGLVVAVVLAVLARRAARRTEAAPGTGRLSADDVAYLSGGGSQVVLAAVARMLEAGSLRASRGSWLSVTGLAAQHPLDRAILAELNSRSSPAATLGSLRAKFEGHPLVGQVRNRLETLGLVVSRRQQWRGRLQGAAGFGVLLVIGFLRISAGTGNGRPVGFLVAFLVVTAVAGLITLAVKGRRLTTAGEQTLAHFRSNIARPAPRRQDDLALLGGAAMLVAIGGFAAFPDEEVSKVLALPASGGSSGSSCSGSSSSSSCSSSSSGGSSCGGGGGGCGG